MINLRGCKMWKRLIFIVFDETISVANLNSPPAPGHTETSFSHAPLPSTAETTFVPRSSGVTRPSTGSRGGRGGRGARGSSYSRLSPPSHPPPRQPRERWPPETQEAQPGVQVRDIVE